MGLFNHGATREWARKQLGTDVVVMLTQDAEAVDEFALERLVAPIQAAAAVVAYGRQIPREGADFFEAFPREFNYPSESHVRSISDAPRYGVYTFFCSNSFAAYSNSALDKIGGFQPILTNEDYFAVARLLLNGGRIAYVGDAVVKHSHRYRLGEEFRRYFDTGYVRAENQWVNAVVGQAERRGLGLLSAMLGKLLRTQPWLAPYAVVQAICKWAGYRAGFAAYRGPLWLKKSLSGQPSYWTSRFYSGLEDESGS
jgi:rhamnosyltransferase